MTTFADAVIAWQKLHGRHNLPWQNTSSPYAIWVSEIMLQQTQVAAVIGYYSSFMERFPNISALANASEEQVLQHWSGLGYYSRARNLHSAAQKIIVEFNGEFPQKFDDILSLPGIGRSTAAAISTFAFNQAMPILDGNVKRVFARYFLIEGWPSLPSVEKLMWQIATRENPSNHAIAYTQGLMDLGATLCTRSRPQCHICPIKNNCQAHIQLKTQLLPTPKPRKTLPERSTTMLIYMNANEVMLEKRASKGIWGGLWSFPEVAVAPSEGQLLPTFSHAFTHFKLHIEPVLIKTNKQNNKQNTLWVGLDEAVEAAIPTPVRKILQSLISKNKAAQVN
jgi:A/G-specific adenine glycosylase